MRGCQPEPLHGKKSGTYGAGSSVGQSVGLWFRRSRVRDPHGTHNNLKSMNKDFTEKFLANRDETGRFIVKSKKTGKTYFVEAIDGDERTLWGDYDPATKSFQTAGYGKYKGSVKPEESMITKENGFEKIHSLKPGESPLEYIERIDEEYFKIRE